MSVVDPDNFQVPPEIKERVAQKLRNSGALKQIARKIKVGMTAAIHELRNPNAKSSLELQIIGVDDKAERAALQSIYSFLEQKGLDYTLSALQQETQIPKENVAVYDIRDIVADEDFEEEEEVAPYESY